ncbi:MAG: hypothetical protein ACK559_35940, partial [bacterium]
GQGVGSLGSQRLGSGLPAAAAEAAALAAAAADGRTTGSGTSGRESISWAPPPSSICRADDRVDSVP